MNVLYEETVPGGWAWSHVLKKGTALELTSGPDHSCASLSFYNPVDPGERYNFPDTLKGQFTAVLTKGHALYTDMGRIALTIVEDEFGGHDPLTGWLTQDDLEKKYGRKTYQKWRNGWNQSGYALLVTEIGKYGLDQRDLSAVINFFCRVQADGEGRLSLEKTARPQTRVVLQAEMDTLVVLAATQHPFDPRLSWDPQPIGLKILDSRIPAEENPAWQTCEQNRRGFANTRLYHL